MDGEWKDPALANPLPRIKDLLLETKDRVLVQRYGIWLIKHDPEASLKVRSVSVLFAFNDERSTNRVPQSVIYH